MLYAACQLRQSVASAEFLSQSTSGLVPSPVAVAGGPTQEALPPFGRFSRLVRRSLARAAGGKAVIMLYPRGASHVDTFDPKLNWPLCGQSPSQFRRTCSLQFMKASDGKLMAAVFKNTANRTISDLFQNVAWHADDLR